MKIAVVLEYFDFFVHLSKLDKDNDYFFLTQRTSIKKQKIENLFEFQFVKKSGEQLNINNNFDYCFAHSIKLSSIKTDVNELYYAETLFFRNFLINNEINLILTGATTSFERCAINEAKNLGIKVLVVWEGFFRPDTISYDTQGMNFESSFAKIDPRKIEKYSPSSDFQIFFDQYKKRLINQKINDNMLREIFHKKFNIILQLKRRYYDKNDIERIRVPISKLLIARFGFYFTAHRYYEISEIDTPFIFFPLQTHTDSNVAINSDFFPFKQKFYGFLEFYKKSLLSKKYLLVIKEHPMDLLRIYYRKDIMKGNVFWIKPTTSTSTILSSPHCKGTFAVNSTVGMESLILEKPTITFGKAFYNNNGLANFLSPARLNDYDIMKYLNKDINKDYLYRFLGYVFDNNQIIGNLDRKPSKEIIGKFNEIFEKL